MRLGHEAAAYVSGKFPKEMELKFEKVAQPFLLLHVNRYRGSLVLLAWTGRHASPLHAQHSW